MKQTQLTISEPIRFWSEGDENCFFAWLKAVRGFHDVIGEGRQLHIYLSSVEPDTVRELTALFKRYGVDLGVLMNLAAPT